MWRLVEAVDHAVGLALRERGAVRRLHVAPELARGRIAAVYRLLEDQVVVLLGRLRAAARAQLTVSARAGRDREGTGVLLERAPGGDRLLLVPLLRERLLLEPPLFFELLPSPELLLLLLELLGLLLLLVPLPVRDIGVVRRVVAALIRDGLGVPRLKPLTLRLGVVLRLLEELVRLGGGSCSRTGVALLRTTGAVASGSRATANCGAGGRRAGSMPAAARPEGAVSASGTP